MQTYEIKPYLSGKLAIKTGYYILYDNRIKGKDKDRAIKCSKNLSELEDLQEKLYNGSLEIKPIKSQKRFNRPPNAPKPRQETETTISL